MKLKLDLNPPAGPPIRLYLIKSNPCQDGCERFPKFMKLLDITQTGIKYIRIATFAAAWLATVSLLASDVGTSHAQHGNRMAWWRGARFGMFIHWGIYAIPAQGEWYIVTK